MSKFGFMLLKTWILLGLIFFIASAFEVKNAAWGAPLSNIDDQIAAEERRRRDLNRQLEEHRAALRRLGAQENTMLARIDRSQQALEQARREIAVLELQIQRLQNSISTLDYEMVKASDRINELILGLNQRLVDIHKFGTAEELLIIFAAEDTHEVLNAVYLMRRLAEHDSFLIDQLQRRRQDLELSKVTLEDHRDRLNERSRSLEQERQSYNSAVRQTNAYLNDIRRQRAVAERAAREMEEAQRAVGQAITELMRQRRERDEAARRSGRGTIGVDHLAGRGRGNMFDWPLRGPISSPFGQRVHPVFRTRMFHSGIDIAAPRGTPVRAAAPGEVLFEGWMRGYGRVIIIDHGRNFSTVYAHLSETRVREGTIVGAGTVIGAVGDTGTTTGYHLHFEVREGSTARNPLDFLRR